MSVINTNVSSIQAQNSLRLNQLSQSSAMERLASGVRINSAKDDAAGLAIGTRMTANIRGLAAAVRNANDGISLTQTAEGSLGQISDNLQRIRELAVQSSNTGNNASDRAAMNNEASQLIAEIDRVASNTSFNSINLLDGTFTAQALQVGAGNTANDRLVISVGSAKSSALGVGASSSYVATKAGSGTVTSTALAVGALSLNGYQVGASVSDGVSFANASASGIAKAAAINAISAQSGVSATVSATTLVGSAADTFTATVAADMLINGVDIGAIGAATAAGDRGTQTAAAVNAKTSQTGVTATATSAGVVTLTAADGRNISVTGTTDGMNKTGLGNMATIATAAVTTAGAFEVNTFTLSSTPLAAAETFTLGGLTYTSTGATSLAELAARFANLANGATTGSVAGLGTYSGAFTGWSTGAGSTTTIVATSATAGNTGDLVKTGTATPVATLAVTAAVTEVSTVTVARALTEGESLTVGGLTFTATAANTIAQVAAAFASLSNGATTGAGTATGSYSGALAAFSTGAGTGTTIVGTSSTAGSPVTDLAIAAVPGRFFTSSTLTLSSSSSAGITLGGTSGLAASNLSVTAASATAVAGAGVSSLDLTTVNGSQAALATLDRAINTITDSRASMGAYQNRLTASISNLETTSQNIQASRSRIMDTNYAKESTNLAKSQIIAQAATAMLAQANQSQQSVLALLK